MSDLSIDARVLIAAWFQWGVGTEVTVGGSTAESVLSERGRAALDDLVANGFVRARPAVDAPLKYGSGRMVYVGTEKCHDKAVRLSRKDVDRHGGWSPTMPNPAAPKPETAQKGGKS